MKGPTSWSMLLTFSYNYTLTPGPSRNNANKLPLTCDCLSVSLSQSDSRLKGKKTSFVSCFPEVSGHHGREYMIAGTLPYLAEGACNNGLFPLVQSGSRESRQKPEADVIFKCLLLVTQFYRPDSTSEGPTAFQRAPQARDQAFKSGASRGDFRFKPQPVQNTSRNLQHFPGVWVILIPRLAVIQLYAQASCFPSFPRAPPPHPILTEHSRLTQPSYRHDDTKSTLGEGVPGDTLRSTPPFCWCRILAHCLVFQNFGFWFCAMNGKW